MLWLAPRILPSCWFIAFCGVVAFGQELPGFRSEQARNAVQAYREATKKLDEYYLKHMSEVAGKYKGEKQGFLTTLIDALRQAQEVAAKEGDLDEAVRIRGAAASLKTVPLDPPTGAGLGKKTTEPRDSSELRKEVERLQKLVAAKGRAVLPTAKGLHDSLVGTTWAGIDPASGDPFVVEFRPEGIVLAKHNKDERGEWYPIDGYTVMAFWGATYVFNFAGNQAITVVHHNKRQYQLARRR